MLAHPILRIPLHHPATIGTIHLTDPKRWHPSCKRLQSSSLLLSPVHKSATLPAHASCQAKREPNAQPPTPDASDGHSRG